MGRFVFIAVAFLCFAATATPSLAFGTITVPGWQNREHEKITRLSLSCATPHGGGAVANCFQAGSIDQLAGSGGAFGAVGAPDNPLRGLISSIEAHCDDGDYLNIPNYPQDQGTANQHLLDCLAYMKNHFDVAVQMAGRLVTTTNVINENELIGLLGCTFLGGSANGRGKCGVIEEFGLVLHASEDFYSHTNWADVADLHGTVLPGVLPGTPRNPDGLGNNAPTNFLQLNAGPIATAVPNGLISGCFVSKPETRYCNEGSGRTKHMDINKDGGQITVNAINGAVTPRGQIGANFNNAVTVAIADTRDKWAELQAAIGARYPGARGTTIICVLTNDDPVANCGATTQGRSFFSRIFDISIFIGALGALGAGGYFYLRGRRGGTAQPA